MINSKRVFMDPLVQGNMARLEGTAGTAVPPGLPKADNVPQYSQDKSLNYRRSYMSCSLSGQETLEPPSAWSPSRTFVRNGASPVVHSSATEGTITNPTFYRPEKVSFPVDSNSPVAVQELALKQKLAYYIRSKQSPNTAGVVSPVAFRKLPIACPSLSPSRAENSGGLAIPKPVYGYSPCCTDRKCPVNHNYAMGRELQMAPPQMFEDEWSSHYRHWAYLHKKKQEALMQQRILPFEHCGERVPLKDVTTQGYHGLSPSRPRRMSAFSEPSHSSYPYSPARPFVPPSPEHCQRLQMHPQMHKDLPPMYEAVTRMRYGSPTQVYPDHHHVYKYREIPQHSLLYCSQDNTEVYRAQNPHHMVEKEASGQCPVPPPYYTDLPDSYPMIPTGLPAVSNLPAYPTYRMNLNSGQVNPFTERPRPPPIMHQVDRPLDFSMRKEQNADTQQEPHRELGISGTFHPTQVPNHVDSQNCTLGTANQSRDGFPVSGSHNYTVSPQYTGSISNKKQDLCMPESQANVRLILKRRRDEKDNACEDESLEKVQKLDQQLSDERQLPSCPPMPVINKVFSLAPYKAYLEAAGMFSHENSSKSTPPKDSKPTKEEPEKQCTDPETTIGQEGLKLKETPQDGNHNTDELQLVEVKKEKVEPDESSCQSEMYDNPDPAISHDCINESVKEEPADLKPVVCETDHSLVVVKSDTEPECKTEAPEMPEPSLEFNTEPSPMDRVETVQTPSSGPNASDLTVTLPAEPQTSPQTMFSVSKIPAHCLKLTSYNIIVPKVLKPPVPPSPETVQSAADSRLAMSSSRQARYLFMELHQSLCRLISACVSQTPQLELRKWLSSLDLVSPPTKTQKVSCLLGSKAREFWLKGQETAVALQKVVGQFENYVRTQECPFPHVIRAGAVFIPMLVVKEVLFPQVQGTFIDQVLQEHRVELRPTTLSEERHLTQLHKRAFSSKLRRLLSLKHLPDIYPDVLNLLYYESVCKFLGIKISFTFERESAECCDESEGFNQLEVCYGSPKPQTTDTLTFPENHKETSCLKMHKSKGRVKSACKRVFLGEDSSSAEDDPAEESTTWCFEGCLEGEGEEWECSTTACSDEEGHVVVKIEEDAVVEPENSWGQPLTSDDLSTESSETEMEKSSWSCPQSHSSSSFCKSHSGIVLKLKKVYCANSRRGQVLHYQRVQENSEPQDLRNSECRHRNCHSKKEHQVSKNKKRDTFSTKVRRKRYHTYLATQGSSKHRRRWVLRSAVQRARQALRKRFPDLVGKRIHHLYEENDKTEVWYRGMVLRIHEPHPNPLKTVFEVKYDSEPEWQYYLELLMDYKKGWLKIED